MPPLAVIGSVVSPTVYTLKAGSRRPTMLTDSNTSHGPQKSMMTAPSEMRNATGIEPEVGTGSGAAGETGPGATASAAAVEPDDASGARPKAVDLRINCRLFMMGTSDSKFRKNPWP